MVFHFEFSLSFSEDYFPIIGRHKRLLISILILLYLMTSSEMRLHWIKAIQYQLAINTYDINFPPFDYGDLIKYVYEL